MAKKESFLKTLDDVTLKLILDGVLTPEDIKNGIEILPEWLHSSRLDRKTIMWAMRNLYGQKYPQTSYPLKIFKKDAKMYYSKMNETPAIKVTAGNRSIIISDNEQEETGRYESKINSKRLIDEIINIKKEMKEFELYDLEYPKDEVKKIVDILFDSKQIKLEESAIPDILSEMAINFGEYYKWMEQEKQEIEKIRKEQENAPIELIGGFIQPAKDEYGPRSKNVVDPTPERVSDIYSFSERDKMLRKLNPERIVKFTSTDEEGQIINGAYTCYIYKEPQGNKGYLVISEPLEGDKSTRVFYVDDKYVEDMKEGEEDLNRFWEEFVKLYIEDMTRTEFSEEKNTCIFNHTEDLDAYRKKIDEVINGIEKNPGTLQDKRAVMNAKRASVKLFGKFKYKQELLEGVTLDRVNMARQAVFENKTQTKEGDTRDGK